MSSYLDAIQEKLNNKAPRSYLDDIQDKLTEENDNRDPIDKVNQNLNGV